MTDLSASNLNKRRKTQKDRIVALRTGLLAIFYGTISIIVIAGVAAAISGGSSEATAAVAVRSAIARGVTMLPDAVKSAGVISGLSNVGMITLFGWIQQLPKEGIRLTKCIKQYDRYLSDTAPTNYKNLQGLCSQTQDMMDAYQTANETAKEASIIGDLTQTGRAIQNDLKNDLYVIKKNERKEYGKQVLVI